MVSSGVVSRVGEWIFQCPLSFSLSLSLSFSLCLSVSLSVCLCLSLSFSHAEGTRHQRQQWWNEHRSPSPPRTTSPSLSASVTHFNDVKEGSLQENRSAKSAT